MGKGAATAFEDLGAHLTGNMHACVMVKDPSSNTYVRNNILGDGFYAAYHPETDPRHIEVQLFEKLKKHYSGSFDNIPNGATIFIAARWSPCVNCTSFSLPRLLNEMKVGSRGLKVKFRFDRYYSKTDWTYEGQSNLWSDNPTAQYNYDALSNKFPSFTNDEALFDEEHGLPRGVTVLRQRTRRSVVFAPRSQGRTSFAQDYRL